MMKRKLIFPLVLALMLTGCGSAPVHVTDSELEELHSAALASETENEDTEKQTAELTEALTTEEITEAPTEPTTEEPTEPTTEEPTEPTTEEPTVPPLDEPDGAVNMQSGCLVVNSGTNHARAIELCGGNMNVGARFANVISSFKNKIGDTNVWCMVVPTSAAFYVPEGYQDKTCDQKAQYDNIVANLSNGVQGVPVYDAELMHRNEETYSRTDYHWQPLGAYYAAAEFAKVADVPFADLSTYEKVEREGYVGAFARVNKISELNNAAERFTYYKPSNLGSVNCTYFNNDLSGERSGSMFFENNSIAASYTVFIGTDDCIFKAVTPVDNGRVLVIFKDSYGNALVPFLTESFSKIYLCDFRFFNTDAATLCANVGATDVLFAMSTVAVTSSGKVDTLAGNLGV